jgi:ribosome-associated protein
MNPTQSIRERNLESECTFTASRSSGPGGQNVNKVNTKIDLRFHISGSALLTQDEKEKLLERLKNRVTEEGLIIISSQQSRSQLKNKKLAIEKFYQMLEDALEEPPERKPVKMPASLKAKRLEEKKQKSEKKALRKPPLPE